MNEKWINESRENDSTDHSCYSMENSFASVIVRKPYSGELDNDNQWIAVFNIKWTQPMPMFVIAPKEQTLIVCADFESAVSAGEKWFDDVSSHCGNEVKKKISKYQRIAAEKGYKSGWVWHQIKGDYTVDIANEFLPK